MKKSEKIKTPKPKKDRPSRAVSQKKPQQNIAPDKITLLVTVVNREKEEFFLDLIQSFHCNMQLSANAYGTAQKALGLLTPDAEKTVIFSVLTVANAKLALDVLEEKFHTIRGGKGVAFTVPITSTIGVLIYRFLANKE